MSKNESYNMPKHQKLWCAAFTKVFITYYQIRKNRNHTKYLAYCNSTQDKLLFFAWVTHAWFTERKITASDITIEMGVSRKFVDECVKDSTAEGWIIKEKGDRNQVYLIPSEEVIECSAELAEYHNTGISPKVNEARDIYNSVVEGRIEQLQKDFQMNPLKTTHLGGLEKNIHDFIINPKITKNRKVAKD